jgi:hypothetical protein
VHDRSQAIHIAASRNSGIAVAAVPQEISTGSKVLRTRGADEAGVLRNQQVHALFPDGHTIKIMLRIKSEDMFGIGFRAHSFE